MARFILFIISFIPLTLFSQGRDEIFLGNVISDTSSFSKIKIPDSCPLKLPSILDSKNLIEIRIYGFVPFHDVTRYPLNMYVVITYDKDWDVKNYNYEYYNDTLKFIQQVTRYNAKYGNMIKSMNYRFTYSKPENNPDIDSVIKQLGKMNFFAFSEYDKDTKMVLNKRDKRILPINEETMDAGVLLVEYKIDDRYRRFCFYEGDSSKFEEAVRIFFKIFMSNKFHE